MLFPWIFFGLDLGHDFDPNVTCLSRLVLPTSDIDLLTINWTTGERLTLWTLRLTWRKVNIIENLRQNNVDGSVLCNRVNGVSVSDHSVTYIFTWRSRLSRCNIVRIQLVLFVVSSYIMSDKPFTNLRFVFMKAMLHCVGLQIAHNANFYIIML